MPDDLVCEAERTVEFGQSSGLGVGLDHHVVALGAVTHRVGQTTLAPNVRGYRLGTCSGELLGEAVDQCPDGVLLQAGVEDDHDFIGPHRRLTYLSLWARGLGQASRLGSGLSGAGPSDA